MEGDDVLYQFVGDEGDGWSDDEEEYFPAESREVAEPAVELVNTRNRVFSTVPWVVGRL